MGVAIDLNKKGWQKLFRKTNLDHLDKRSVGALTTLGQEAVALADHNREFTQWTGNTVSSYMSGIYNNGKVVNILSDLPNIIHKKIEKGESVFLPHPVEGSPREYVGKVDTTTDYGTELSERTIAEHKPKSRYEMLVTTGTEYSEYLEKVQELDVLTKTYEDIKHNSPNGLKILMAENE